MKSAKTTERRTNGGASVVIELNPTKEAKRRSREFVGKIPGSRVVPNKKKNPTRQRDDFKSCLEEL